MPWPKGRSKYTAERAAVDREIDLLFARYDTILAADVSSVAQIKLFVALRGGMAPLVKCCSSCTRHHAVLSAQRARVMRLIRLINGRIGELLLVALEKGERLPGRRTKDNRDLPCVESIGLTRRYASYWLRLARLARQQKGDFEQRLDTALLVDPKREKICALARRRHAEKRQRIAAERLAEERRQEEQRIQLERRRVEKLHHQEVRKVIDRQRDDAGRAKMILGDWYTDENGCLSRYLCTAPLDAKGKTENIVAQCIADHAAREIAKRENFEAEANKSSQPHFTVVDRSADADKYVPVNNWKGISWDQGRRRQPVSQFGS